MNARQNSSPPSATKPQQLPHPPLDPEAVELMVRQCIRHTWYMIAGFLASFGLMSLFFVLR